MKLAHLHLQDSFGNKSTLICRLEDEAIQYVFYQGVMSSGIGLSLSNLQCDLPIEKEYPNQTKEQFKGALIKIINDKSVKKVIHDVLEVTF